MEEDGEEAAAEDAPIATALGIGAAAVEAACDFSSAVTCFLIWLNMSMSSAQTPQERRARAFAGESVARGVWEATAGGMLDVVGVLLGIGGRA